MIGPATWAGVLALGLAGIVVGRASAQAGAELTTLSGIYTEEQVVRGEETYFGSCVSCHPRGTYSGDLFKTNWTGRPLSDLYDWVLNKMPKNDPGTLTPGQSADVIAYILKQNNMPAGKTALPTDVAALRTIRIQLR
jgi:mono/diheme cytochrome c family protein